MLNTESWTLVTGSKSKFETLQLAISQAEISVESKLLPCPKPVHELHGSLHTSTKYLYADKIAKTWEHSSEHLGDDLGIGNDVCPKVKGAHESQYRHTLYKYHRKKGKKIEEMGYRDKVDALSWYISLVFGQYQANEPIDLRQSIGVGAFADVMYGVLIQKIYSHFPTNPLSSSNAIREYLTYDSQNHKSVIDNTRDNLDLSINANAAGGIIPMTLLEWYLQTNLKERVVISGLGAENDVSEMEMLGRGFTKHVVRQAYELAKSKKKGVATARALATCATIPITKSGHCSVVWSRDEGRVVAI